ncbi:MAG TPA: lipoyl(octanoyl) transferase LipB [Flavobacteriales bacterium]|nr:lipoyl(octanoyl) transferase LipB [Flavobacteriales bacterium]HIA11226.1 lipoyl(octanoyl) transferase LipB [Flavobacteriales bacterium]
MQKVSYIDLGLINYQEGWDFQEKVFSELVQCKIDNRNLPKSEQRNTESSLIFCEHPHVYTLGKTGSESNLLLDKKQLEDRGANFYKINRGGDITYHGPGQIVGYPIFDLDNFFTDIGKYLRFLEEVVIRTLRDFDIAAGRLEGCTGVWIDPSDTKKARKISAIGVRSSRWVTMHGFAFNVNTDLDYFNNIIPCGIDDKQVTSMKKELGHDINMESVKGSLKGHFENLFEMELTTTLDQFEKAK